jgi:hypothetical protein
MFARRTLSRSLAAAIGITIFIAACSDSPLSPRPEVGSPLLSQGSGSGGSGGGNGSGTNSGGGGGGSGSGGGGGAGTTFIPLPPPSVSVAGSWSTTVIGGVPAGVPRTIALTLTQDLSGHLSGSISNRQIDGTVEPVLGTVSGNSVTITIGNPCGSCTLEAIFTGSSADGLSLSGDLLVLQFTPVTFVRQ